MEENKTSGATTSRNLMIGGIIFAALLLIIGMFLPPVSLGQRLGLTNSQQTTDGNAVEPAATAEASFAVAEEGAAPQGVAVALSSGTADIATTLQSEFLASTAAPEARLTPLGDVYTINTGGSTAVGQVALPIPAGAGAIETLDLYGWDGTGWSFVPSHSDAASGQIVSAEVILPQALAVMQAGPTEPLSATAFVASGSTLPTATLPLLSDVVVDGLTLGSDGSLTGTVEWIPEGGYAQWVRASNVGPIIDQAALSALLSDTAVQQDQIDNLVAVASGGGFAGVVLDYQEVPENQAAAFTGFVAKLAESLHAQNLRLAVALGTPAFTGTAWNTGGQDWAGIGTLADQVYVELPLDPTQYDASDAADKVLEFATDEIDRSKVRALFSAAAVDRIGESFSSLSNDDALANFGKLQFVQGEAEVAPNETVEVALSGTANPLEWDGESLTYKYSYEKNGEQHDVWLGSEAALSHRLQQANAFNVNGLGVQGLGGVENGAGYAAALGSALGTAEAPQPTGAAIVWTVRNANDSVLASDSGSALSFSWDVGADEGDYTVNADFALGDNIANLDTLTVAVKTPVEEVVTEATPEAETTPEATPAATNAVTTGFTGDADAVVNVGANIRTGPGLTYGTLSDGVNPGTELQITGRNSDSSWLQVVLPDGREAWIFASLVTVNSGLNLADVAVVEAAAPAAAAPATTEGGDAADAEVPAAAPAPVAAAPVSNPGFELGGQSQSFANPALMSAAGMNWIKFQHKWGPGDSPDAVAGRIQQAHANGFKVLLSIPGSETYPGSIDFSGYVEFLRGVAALGPDAIEVWNEENIDFEWPAGQIDPTSYVNNMLAPAYNAIKSANPSVMVISGAPAPTGYFGGGCGASGCDDNAYLSGMAAAGAASYMDCVGAHYNAGATPPSQSSGHPAGGSHYSWYFQPMLDLYYGTLGKPVCFTELGYLSGDGFGGVPSRFSWAANTSVSEHAQWLAEAVSMAANSGKSRLAIIFNVDFTQYGDDPQAGYAIIRPDGSCPACATLGQVMGR